MDIWNIDLISVVIPVYNEEKNIKNVYYKTKAVLSSLNRSYEIIFIDDGSKDKTYGILRDIQSGDTCVKIIKLAKNYGQLYALLMGFRYSRGEVIITMDGDLQNNPHDISKFLEKMHEGFDIVSGWRYNREDSIIRRIVSRIANWLIRIKAGKRLHDYGCAFTAIRKDLVDRLEDYGRDARFIKPLLVCLANSIAEIKVSHRPRMAEKSKYNMGKIMKLGMDFVFNFRTKPRKNSKLPCVIEEVIR